MKVPKSSATGRRTRSGNIRRRRFLRSAGAAATVLLAGCSGSGDDEETPEGTATATVTQTPVVTTTATPTPSQTPTETPTPTETEQQLEQENLEQRAEEFLQLLGQNRYETVYERFSSELASSLTVSELEQTWSQVTNQIGEYVETVSAEYQGTVEGDEHVVVEAKFTAQQQTFNVYLSEDGVSGFRLAGGQSYEWEQPAYVDQSAFSEQEMSLDATESCDLGATLSLPDRDEPVPGVVLVHGSGPNDRDGTLGPSKPYKELAWGLATEGIAVLRYDKRTGVCNLDATEMTIDDVVTDDALTALNHLRQHDRIDEEGVFVAGHSLGGKMVPRIARRDGTLAGAVMLAAPARSRPEIIVDQVDYLLSLEEDLSDEKREKQLEEIQSQAEKIRTLDIGPEEVVRGAGRPFWRTFQEYDHIETAASLDLPLVLAQGGQDYQVTVEDDLALWREVLYDRQNVTITVYEDLNHLLEPSEGKPSPDEYYRPGVPVDEAVVSDVFEFVSNHA